MNCSGLTDALANEVMGNVEVFVAKILSLPITPSAFFVTSALIAGSSKTASTIKSHSPRSVNSMVGFIKFRTVNFFSSVIFFRFIPIFKRFSA